MPGSFDPADPFVVMSGQDVFLSAKYLLLGFMAQVVRFFRRPKLV
ncbi:hypothetical protein SynBIOSU31_00280 [Synechococcus sp. BIOS-U3-1]|nr:hypothetical protein SynBIOSU31_00280 [Synechococcus sp. BIOS-U3-1]